ncbi:hypothetical protein [Burkholderia sp. B21-007]|uniref:hypothetical protein n=1 Tax=Burkholderia TaxID=32008 RepID=UPI003499538D
MKQISACAAHAAAGAFGRLLADINALGLPVAAEVLDVAPPHYLSDLVSWAAIGARSTASCATAVRSRTRASAEKPPRPRCCAHIAG